ncbi:MAG: protein kinase [Acidobacteria bacterium]|nr:protein kinase [Acidobacteriota bacterium]NIM61778.1 protein kinase [Acidobacteriota bacterium]NIO60022.1 protein kinase [Acidobacteriota bacterium]NIQ29214.1 protein kinase [Acidobacteriota bacterium]NIQ83788.1 protein kinase [Acidobacteriota bacterium]
MRPEAGQELLHYRLIEKVGEGGMGVVWKALDHRLDRPVALKILRDDLDDGPERMARLRREARAVAALNHPNIVTIHAVEEVDDIALLVMELVEGRSLDRIIPEGGLSLGTFYNMAGLLLRAVVAAHERGILHGDLKPANVIVSQDGQMKIMDFGLARLLPKSEKVTLPEDSPTITLETRIQGTMQYMAPEQLRGEPIDARADIFAVGVVLHEMLVGQVPFNADRPADLISAILRDEAPLTHETCSDVPEPLARLVQRCLAKHPDRRVQTARDVLNQLNEIRNEARSGKSVRSIAVLPFADMSPDKDQDYFCEGIAEEILTALTSIEGLRVASRGSTFRFSGQGIDSREIALQLGVTTLLEGSVRKAGSRVRVTVQLVNASDGYQLWSERYDREMQDIFEIQDQIAHSVVEALKIALTPTERKALSKPKARELEAYEHYLRGRRFFYKLTRRNLEFSREMFERAIEIDPDYALAHCGLADCYAFLYLWYEQREEFIRGAETASRRAVELSPDLAEAHASLGLALTWREDCADAAEVHFETALRLNPRLFEACYFFARDCLSRGRLEKAARLFERAIEVRPEDYQAALLLPQVYLALGQEDKSERAAQRGLEIVERHLQLNPDDVRALYLASGRWVQAGDRERGLSLVRQAIEMEPEEPTVLFNAACTFAQAGELDTAIDYLGRAVVGGFGHRRWIEHDSDLDPLRDHPRFRKLMEHLSDRT